MKLTLIISLVLIISFAINPASNGRSITIISPFYFQIKYIYVCACVCVSLRIFTRDKLVVDSKREKSYVNRCEVDTWITFGRKYGFMEIGETIFFLKDWWTVVFGRNTWIVKNRRSRKDLPVAIFQEGQSREIICIIFSTTLFGHPWIKYFFPLVYIYTFSWNVRMKSRFVIPFRHWC